MSPRRWTIRWRLTLWNSAVLFLLFCLFSVVLLAMVHQHLRAQADRMMREELRELLEDFRRMDETGEFIAELNRRFAVHADYFFQILDSHRQPIFRSRYLTNIELPVPPDPREIRGETFEDIDLPVGKFRLLTMAIRDSRSDPLILQVVTQRAAMRQEFGWYVGLLLAALPFVILVLIATGHMLARQALRPLEQIAETASRISAENLTERLHSDHPGDELGKLTTTLNAMFDRLGISVAQMKQFTSDAAHELRSPLAALKARLEVALRADRSSSEYQNVIHETLSETNHMTDLVDQLLMLSRQDSGLQSISFDEVRVDVVLIDVIDRIRSLAESRDQTILVRGLAPWVTSGDDVWLSLLFWNLLDNASKYTPEKGLIEVWANAEGDRWVCTVRDTGRGIEEKHLTKIFDRFYRVDSSRTRAEGGTGLGLAICKSIVDAHRGTITVNSQPGVGSEFRLELPGQPAQPDLD